MDTNSVLTRSMRCVLYLRVSSEEQTKNFSISTQEELCRGEAQRKGYEVDKVFVEGGHSASTISGRPELLKLLDYCQQQKNDIGAAIAYRIDRIARNASDYLAVRKTLSSKGIVLLSATEPTGSSPTEKLVETVLAAIAELENGIKSERTTNGMKARFLSGLPPTSPPRGYLSKDGKVYNDPSAYDLIKQAWETMATGSVSLAYITDRLQAGGIKTRRGAVSKMFRNPFYMGILRSIKWHQEVKGQHVPMISEATFYAVQRVLLGKSASQITRPHIRDNEEMPLRGALYCATCGKPFTGAYSTGKNGGKFLYYFCPKRCPQTNVSAKSVNEQLKAIVHAIEPTEACWNAFRIKLHVEYTKRINVLKSKQKEAESEMVRVKDRYTTLVEKNMSGLYSDEIFKQEETKIKNELMVLELVKNEHRIDRYSLEEVEHFITAMLKDLWRLYEQSNLHQKRVLLSSLFAEKLVVEDKTIRTPRIGALYQAVSSLQPSKVHKVHYSADGESRTPKPYGIRS